MLLREWQRKTALEKRVKEDQAILRTLATRGDMSQIQRVERRELPMQRPPTTTQAASLAIIEGIGEKLLVYWQAHCLACGLVGKATSIHGAVKCGRAHVLGLHRKNGYSRAQMRFPIRVYPLAQRAEREPPVPFIP